MKKNSAEGHVCVYCDRPAEPDTYPPVCSEHADARKKRASSGSVETLKELEVMEGGPGNGEYSEHVGDV